MDRSSFLKSLFVLVDSPKLLAELKSKPKRVINAGIFNDLQFVLPEWVPIFVEKYGTTGFITAVQTMGSVTEYSLHPLDLGDLQSFQSFCERK